MTLITKQQKENTISKKYSEDSSSWNSFRTPQADIWEKENEICLELELPGIKKEEVDISYVNGELTIEAKRTTRKTEEKSEYEYSEFENVSFYRSFTLEDNIEEDKIQAKLENGILQVKLPLKVSPKKQISIN